MMHQFDGWLVLNSRKATKVGAKDWVVAVTTKFGNSNKQKV